MAGVPPVPPGETPAYLRVANALRERIRNGEFPPHSRIPVRSELMATHAVGAAAAREAVRVLTAEGLLEGRRGLGTFVRARRTEVHLVRHWSADIGNRMPFAVAMAGQPDVIPTWTVETDTDVPASASVAARLDVAPGDRCVCSTYLFRIGPDVVMRHISWEPYAITGGTPIVLPERGPLGGAGVQVRMAAIGHVSTRAVENVTARAALPDEAADLEIAAGTALIALERVWRTDNGPVETADILIPGTTNWVRYELPAAPAPIERY